MTYCTSKVINWKYEFWNGQTLSLFMPVEVLRRDSRKTKRLKSLKTYQNAEIKLQVFIYWHMQSCSKSDCFGQELSSVLLTHSHSGTDDSHWLKRLLPPFLIHFLSSSAHVTQDWRPEIWYQHLFLAGRLFFIFLDALLSTNSPKTHYLMYFVKGKEWTIIFYDLRWTPSCNTSQKLKPFCKNGWCKIPPVA